MLSKVRSVFAAGALILALAGCQTMTGKTLGQNIDDSSITANVKAHLATDKISSLTRIDVDTNRGVVYLNGTVDSAEERARAERIARGVNGVSDVANNLQISSSHR